MLTLSKVEAIESLRNVAIMETVAGPVRVGCSETVRSFLEYATTGAAISKDIWVRTYEVVESEAEMGRMRERQNVQKYHPKRTWTQTFPQRGAVT